MAINRKFFFDTVRARLFGGRLTALFNLNMFPCSSILDMVNGFSTHAVAFRYFILRSRVFQYLPHLLLCQFCIRGFAVSMAVVTNSIHHIVFVRPATQVCRVAARRIVTNIMANHFPVQILSGLNRIYQPMGLVHTPLIVHPAVAQSVSISLPQPASIRFVNTSIKSFFGSFATFRRLVARIRAICGTILSFGNEGFSAPFALIVTVNFRSLKSTRIRAIHPFRGSEGIKGGSAMLANVWYVGVSHNFLLFRNLWSGLRELLAQFRRPFFILAHC